MKMVEFPTYEEMGKKVAEKALDEILYDGKSIREWMRIIVSEDAISRQAVLNLAKFDGRDGLGSIIHAFDVEQLPPVMPVENQVSCDDCISRQVVLDLPKNTERGFGGKILEQSINIEYIKALPPVTPAEKVGHWIPPQCDDGMSDPIYYQVRCSECGFDLDPQTFGEELKKYGADRFCPKCGAKMQEVKE